MQPISDGLHRDDKPIKRPSLKTAPTSMNQAINHYARTTMKGNDELSLARFTHENQPDRSTSTSETVDHESAANLHSEAFRLHNAKNIITHLQLMIRETIETNSRLTTKPIEQIASLLTDTPFDGIQAQSIGSHLICLSESLAQDHQSVTRSLLALDQSIEELTTVLSGGNAPQQINKTSCFSVDEFLCELAGQCEQSLSRDGINLSISTEHCPPITSDRTLLHQVMLNLVNNAQEAFQNYLTPIKKINLEHRHIDGWHRIQIKDNGCGIPKSAQTKILDLGYTTRDDGKGFGLCFCVEAMHQLHGYLEIDSDGDGKGTTVTLHLPSI